MYYQNDDLRSVDLFWFGVDRTGRIAVFCSGGSQAVPPQLSQAGNSILNLYFEHFSENLTSDLESDDQTLQFYAERGLYGFDHKTGDSYRAAVRPLDPISLGELPDFIRSLFDLPVLSVAFTDVETIDDALITGSEHRIVPGMSEMEQKDDWAVNNSLWQEFIEDFSLRFEKDETTGVYELEDFCEFCPNCLEERGNYVELDCETDSRLDPVQYWEMARYSFTRAWKCRLCGFRAVQKNESLPGGIKH